MSWNERIKAAREAQKLTREQTVRKNAGLSARGQNGRRPNPRRLGAGRQRAQGDPGNRAGAGVGLP